MQPSLRYVCISTGCRHIEHQLADIRNEVIKAQYMAYLLLLLVLSEFHHLFFRFGVLSFGSLSFGILIFKILKFGVLKVGEILIGLILRILFTPESESASSEPERSL